MVELVEQVAIEMACLNHSFLLSSCLHGVCCPSPRGRAVSIAVVSMLALRGCLGNPQGSLRSFRLSLLAAHRRRVEMRCRRASLDGFVP